MPERLHCIVGDLSHSPPHISISYKKLRWSMKTTNRTRHIVKETMWGWGCGTCDVIMVMNLLRPAVVPSQHVFPPSITIPHLTRLTPPFRSSYATNNDIQQPQIKADLYQLFQGTNRGIFGVPSTKKTQIESLVELLEAQNPTPDPTFNLHKVFFFEISSHFDRLVLFIFK